MHELGAPPVQLDLSAEMMDDSRYSKKALLIRKLSSETFILYCSLTYCLVFFILDIFISNPYIAGLLLESLPNLQSLNLFMSVFYNLHYNFFASITLKSDVQMCVSY